MLLAGAPRHRIVSLIAPCKARRLAPSGGASEALVCVLPETVDPTAASSEASKDQLFARVIDSLVARYAVAGRSAMLAYQI